MPNSSRFAGPSRASSTAGQRFKAPSKCLQPVIDFAIANGWAVSKTKCQHLRFTKPGCAPVFSSGTPGDSRVIQNTIAKLRRKDREAA